MSWIPPVAGHVKEAFAVRRRCSATAATASTAEGADTRSGRPGEAPAETVAHWPSAARDIDTRFAASRSRSSESALKAPATVPIGGVGNAFANDAKRQRNKSAMKQKEKGHGAAHVKACFARVGAFSTYKKSVRRPVLRYLSIYIYLCINIIDIICAFFFFFFFLFLFLFLFCFVLFFFCFVLCGVCASWHDHAHLLKAALQYL